MNRYSYHQTNSGTQSSLTTRENAVKVSNRIFELYDDNRDGNLDVNEVMPMMKDAYSGQGINFNPTYEDAEAYHRILDINNDGRVTLDDIQNFTFNNLLSPGDRVERFEQPVQKVYSSEVQKRLDLARRLFHQVDQDNSGYIGEEEVPALLRATYAEMGQHNYQPTRDDVKSWMDVVDTDRDGKVSLPDYEVFVIRSLKNAGFEIDSQGIVM